MVTNPTPLIALLDELREKREGISGEYWRLGIRGGANCNQMIVVDDSLEWFNELSVCLVSGIPNTTNLSEMLSLIANNEKWRPGFLRGQYIAAHSPAAMSRLDAMVRELIAENERLKSNLETEGVDAD